MIQRVGQMDQRKIEQPDKAVRNAVQEHEEDEKDQRADQGLDAAELAAQGEGDQHRAAVQVEHAEPDRLIGHEQHRDDRDEETAEIDEDTAPVAVV